MSTSATDRVKACHARKAARGECRACKNPVAPGSNRCALHRAQHKSKMRDYRNGLDTALQQAREAIGT